MSTYKLYYFDSKGRAELTRWILEAGGITYEDIRLSREDWVKMKPDTPFGQMPVLEVDGIRIAQSNSIARFAAKKTGLAGKGDLEEAKANMMVDCMEDMVKPLMPVFFAASDAEKGAALKKWQDELKGRYLGYFEKFLTENETGYLVGDGMTWADFALVNALTWVDKVDKIDYDRYPQLQELNNRVLTHPKIEDWIARRPVTEH